MASAFGIIKNHEGEIRVSSEPGVGTTFRIYLPATEKAVEAETGSIQAIQKGEGVILLVDDEKMIIEVGQQMLEKLGYRVIAARSGQQALNVVKEKRANIDLVILDMIMPEMSGSETFNHIRQIDSEIKVLLSSGYSLDGQAVDILNRGCDGFIQKPFSLNNLSQKILELLNTKRA